jgi:hypothetical protein
MSHVLRLLANEPARLRELEQADSKKGGRRSSRRKSV